MALLQALACLKILFELLLKLAWNRQVCLLSKALTWTFPCNHNENGHIDLFSKAFQQNGRCLHEEIKNVPQ